MAWSIPKRVAFRFGFIAGLVFVFPFPIGLLPKTDWLAEQLNAPWEAFVCWFAQAVLGLDRPATEMTGSGDTTFAWVAFLVTLIVAAIGTVIWSVLDRKRTGYPRLAAGALVVLRYVLAMTMLAYGFAKIVNTQFPFPNPTRLDGRIGDMSPMGLLWTFMGYSTPYTVFAGLCEALGAVLLLWRRTTLLGALVIAAVMTNVVAMNLSYDVPVKLYSMQLLLLALIIATPHLRRVVAAVLGYATPEVVPAPRMTRRHERARLVAKAVVVLSIALHIYESVDEASEYRDRTAPLGGIWAVETWTADGIEHPPLTTDAERWRKLAVNPHWATIRSMTDATTNVRIAVDEVARTLTVKTEIWRYSQPDPEHLVLDGVWSGHTLHVTLRLEPDPLLVTSGFHWIQEAPLNR
ncbi:MAG: DoxX family membrane protein [Kofleriaceae bacterium]